MARIRTRSDRSPVKKGHGSDEKTTYQHEDDVALVSERGVVMIQRQRSSGTAVVAAPAAVESPGPTSSTRWEDWFSFASPRQREEILQLAQRQGVLYSHQIPLANSSEPSEEAEIESCGMSRILAGDLSGLLPRTRDAQPPECPTLDLAQREAVARALATPDVFLLEGLPGTGKSHVATEIVREACRRGWRVLLLAPRACSLDFLLEGLRDDARVFPLRYPGPDEIVAQLAPAIQAMTPGRRCQSLAEQMRQSACQLRDTLANFESRWDDHASAWERVRGVALQLRNGAAELRRLETETEKTEARVRAESQATGETELHRGLAALRRKHEEKNLAIARRQAEANAALTQAQVEFEELQPRLDALRPLAEAKRSGRWWTLTWWKAWRRANVVEQYDDLHVQARRAQSAVAAASAALADIASESKLAETEWEAMGDALIQGEIERRRASLLAEQDRCSRQCAEIEETWQEILSGLRESDRPTSIDSAVVEAALAAWQSCFHEAKEKARRTRNLANDLETSNGDFLQRLPQLANVLAARLEFPPSDLAAGIFDLLLIEDAHCVAEADVLRFGRLATRCVLVGDAELDGARADKTEALHQSDEADSPLRAQCFRKLWRILHQDAGALPYVWLRENGRLSCRFRPLPTEELARLEVEFLADFPEIELRISPVPSPSLTQIVFPPEMNLTQAKQFIYRELQELPICRHGSTAWIAEGEERLVCHLTPNAEANDCASVELEKGLYEWAGESHTHRLEFDLRNGWTRGDAERWLQRNLGIQDQGRTLTLSVCHRAQPALAALLSDVFFSGRLLPAQSPTAVDENSGIRFIPVPTPAPENGKKSARSFEPSASPWPREGAGLEIDLAAIRTADRIPADLRSKLPRRGFANYSEAQAVVKHLEAILVGDAALSVRDLAVIALYQGQVDLIRILIERSELLKGLGKIAVNLPDALRHSEFSTVLLSLTRSHSHRAVAIGESPAQFPLACTRARDRVVLFADPGNLIKRAAWQGPLEHLGAASAAEETRHIIPLVRYLQGNGTHQQCFQMHDVAKASRRG